MRALDFSRRTALSELMDSDSTDAETFRASLVDLAKVNFLTLGYRPTLHFLERLNRAGSQPGGRPIRILDVGSGYGDMLRRIDRWAQRRHRAVELIGIDRNPWAASAARGATAFDRPIRFLTADVFAFEPAAPVDVVISALFTHHLEDRALVDFVAWMEATARLGWFVNDLHRHVVPYHLFRVASRLAGFHYFVQHDGPISIARAFDPADWRRTLAATGLGSDAVSVTAWFPYRLCVERTRP